MVSIVSNGDYSRDFSKLFLISVIFDSEHFSTDPAATTINAKRNHIVTLCRSFCVKERAQILEVLMNSKYCHRIIHVCPLSCLHRMFDWLQVCMTCWAVYRVWSKCHHVLFIQWLKPLLPVAMTPMLVSRADESVQSAHTGGGRLVRPLFREWAHWCCRKAQSYFAVCVGWIFPGSPIVRVRFYRISRGRSTFLATSVFGCRHRIGVSRITRGNPSQMKV